MLNNKKILAVIPARSGSKRLPNKNILPLGGKPLIAWSIEAAKKSKYIDEVIVTTDSQEIKQISESYGASIPFLRPKHLSSDTASSVDVIKDIIKKLDDYYDIIILLQPTSPLRSVNDIDSAFEKINPTTKAVISVTKVEHSPLWSNTLPPDLNMKNFIKPEIKNMRSQDLPDFYRLNGAVYIAETSYFLKQNGFLGDYTYAYIMPQKRSIDIDTELDFKIASILLKESSN